MAGEENEPTKRLQPHLSKQDLSTLVSVLILLNFKIVFHQLILPTQHKYKGSAFTTDGLEINPNHQIIMKIFDRVHFNNIHDAFP